MHKFQRLLFGFEQCRITNQNHQQPWKRLQKEPRKSLRDMDLDEVSIWFHIQVSLGSPKLCEGCDIQGGVVIGTARRDSDASVML